MGTLQTVKDYYGKILKTKKDLKTSACCATDRYPTYLQKYVGEIPQEILEKSYGCGTPIPFLLEGKTVLDLGCGTGRDVFLLSKLVGPKGHVIGVDMTPEQLEVARRCLPKNNVSLLEGFMEDLESLGIANNSIDVVVSNCVINLSPNKKRIFSEIFRVLKPGGELYFSDVFSGRRIPKGLAEDPILLGECLGGALYIEDFRRLLAEVGCHDYRVVSNTSITIQNQDIQEKIGMADFYSMTIRAFKLKLEDRCEDYGQIAVYAGTIPESGSAYALDDHHLFEKGRPMPVCRNTAAMLIQTRYAPHFCVEGDLSTHYGLFDCGPKGATVSGQTASNGGCC
jgi:SAM-dependent methyltransferase